MSRLFYVSPYYLCRDFKRNTGSTIVQYINVTRIMNAQRQLMETDKTIMQISKDTGFSNLTHFNRIFKSVTGLSPSGYRKTGQNTMGGLPWKDLNPSSGYSQSASLLAHNLIAASRHFSGSLYSH